MGRKRKRASKVGNAASITRYRGIWPETTVEELLAYLDSGVTFLDPETKAEVERKYEDVDEEISQHLNAVYEDGNYLPEPPRQFSPAQVQNKLHRLWATHCREEFNGRDWKIIYRHGSSCLMNSEDPEQAERVARRSGVIKVKWVERYLRSPRKTRAGSQLSRENHPPPWRSRSASSSSPIAHSRLRGQKVAGQHPLRQRHTESDTSSISSQQSIASQIKVENAGIEIILPGVADSISERTLSHKDSRQSVSPEPEVYGTPSARLASFSDLDDNGDVSILGTTASSSLIERLSRLEKELKALRDESALEIDFWKAKYRIVDDKNAELERANNALVVRIGALIETRDQLTVDDLLKSQATIDDLVKQILSQRRVQSLKRRGDVNVERQTFPGISKLMEDASFHLQEVLKGGSFVPLPVLPELPQEHPLKALVEQAFGFDWDGNDASKFLEQCRRRSDIQQCSVLALSGAALAQWVFKRSQADLIFDRYQDSSSRCSTNRYRHVLDIVTMEDPGFARAIDLEVHTKITEEASFEHFRKGKARALALKLQEALAPLWKGDPEDDDGLDAGIDNDQDITEQLTAVFDKAIDVQCRLVLTGQQYESVWYAPGDPFDETNMTPYKNEGAVSTDMTTVRLTLLPGINQVVDSKVGADFGGFADSRRWPQERVVCLVRPLVWRGCAELH